jgi:hypothetical protein
MSQQPRPDILPHLRAVLDAATPPQQPAPVFAALEQAMQAVIGHRLFTVMRLHVQSGEAERCYTNQPTAYPVGGRKPLTPTPWSEQLLHQHQPYIGRNADDIRAVFFDHELIFSLGCESILNIPVVFDGTVLGTVNLLHQAYWYDPSDIEPGLLLARAAIPAYLAQV